MCRGDHPLQCPNRLGRLLTRARLALSAQFPNCGDPTSQQQPARYLIVNVWEQPASIQDSARVWEAQPSHQRSVAVRGAWGIAGEAGIPSATVGHLVRFHGRNDFGSPVERRSGKIPGVIIPDDSTFGLVARFTEKS